MIQNFYQASLGILYLIFAQTHKSEGMLLQYVGVELARDADIENGLSIAVLLP